jgi:hypothetical protein
MSCSSFRGHKAAKAIQPESNSMISSLQSAFLDLQKAVPNPWGVDGMAAKTFVVPFKRIIHNFQAELQKLVFIE